MRCPSCSDHRYRGSVCDECGYEVPVSVKPSKSKWTYYLLRAKDGIVICSRETPELIGLAYRAKVDSSHRLMIRKSLDRGAKEGEVMWNRYELDPSEALRTGIPIDEWSGNGS